MSNNVDIVFNLLFYFSLKEFRDDNDDDGSYDENNDDGVDDYAPPRQSTYNDVYFVFLFATSRRNI